MKEALFYEKLGNKEARCCLCAHRCLIKEGQFGFCGVRQNIRGILYTHAFGSLAAAHIDPIEKKPLYHFLPGSQSFSVATIGCNFRCGFCQNWEISQKNFILNGKSSFETAAAQNVAPGEIVSAAKLGQCKSIAYTYTEPTIFFEFAMEIGQLARQQGLYNIFVTNGYMTKECLREAARFLDAANVDLKFFTDAAYKRVCAGGLEAVLDSIRFMKEKGVWVEVTTLIIPEENDSEEELSGIARFLASVDKAIPWHISRFHPDYKFTGHKPTSLETLKKAQQIGAQAGLTYIYVGNAPGSGNDTICSSCKKTLITRELFSVLENHAAHGKCEFCGAKVAGVF
jgi:pyruvate formate lyase activating enzyme